MTRRIFALVVSLCCALLLGCDEASLKVFDPTDKLDGDITSECLEDSDCRAGERCVEERCWQACEEDEDCPAGMLCFTESGTCQFPPTEDGDDQPKTDGDEGNEQEDDSLCTEDQTRCDPRNDQIIEICRNEDWELLRFCQGVNEVCREGTCVEGDPLDGDLEPETDGDENEAEEEPIEEDGDSAEVEEVEAECVEGERRCADQVIEECEDGRWQERNACPEDWYCEDGYCERVPADGDEEETDQEPPCRCDSGPCCDGCNFLSGGTPCETLTPLFTCNGTTSCGSDLYAMSQTRLCAGGTSVCNGGIQTGPLELHTDCEASERCYQNGTSSGGCTPDAACQCDCIEGPCCDGCRFRSSETMCDGAAQTESRCESVNVNDPNDTCGARPQHRNEVQFCTGQDAACTGETQWQPWEYDPLSCLAEERCDVNADPICTPDAACTRQCTEGPCCDTTTYTYKVPGTICQTEVEVEYGCPDAAYCGGDYKLRIKDRSCSGFGTACDGSLIARAWQLVADCPGTQSCGVGGCQDDLACACVCSEGVCCDGCYLLHGDSICNNDIGEEYGCPWGETAGSDVGVRTRVQYCSGDSTDCTGNPGWMAWTHHEDCAMWQTCRDAACVNLTPCSTNADCALYGDLYCRDGNCLPHVDPCDEDSDCEADEFCNSAYGECLPQNVVCASNKDCQGYDHYDRCDTSYGFCYDPDCFDQNGKRVCCDINRNNCRPGTTCSLVDSITYPDGYYCQGCTNRNNCYSNWQCTWLIGQGDICRP